MNNRKLASFSILVDDINSAIEEKASLFSKAPKAETVTATNAVKKTAKKERNEAGKNALALIFEYDKCNEFAKVIMDNACLHISVEKSGIRFLEDEWNRPRRNYDALKYDEIAIEATKEFLEYCRRDKNKKERYKFIFWALMILTVDDQDAEDHISYICDLAKRLYITDNEFEDIIQIIRTIYHKNEKEYKFKSEIVPLIFTPALNLY